jgi:nucleoside-diphosphate-sugar epimerase
VEDTAVARIFNSYGPGMRLDDGRMVTGFACQALLGEPVTVTGLDTPLLAADGGNRLAGGDPASQ